MLVSIDHLIVAVPDLDAAAAEIEAAVGLRATGGGRHEGLGTTNRLVWFGDSYAEIVAVEDEALARASWIGARALARLAGGPGFVGWAIRTDALDADVRAARSTGARFGDPMPGDRLRADGTVVRWRLALPDSGTPVETPFLIERDETSAEWTPADRSARSIEAHPLGGPARLDVLELPTTDIPGAILRYLRTFGIRFRPSLAGGGARDANVGRQILRLRPTPAGAPADPVPHVRLAVPGAAPRSVEALGVRWTVRPGG